MASGDPKKVVNEPAVVTAYLGQDDDEIGEEEE
ncbi:ABC transporter ATP-binding protein C-terminal domain-containing protein [Fusobacterium ulcerans]